MELLLQLDITILVIVLYAVVIERYSNDVESIIKADRFLNYAVPAALVFSAVTMAASIYFYLTN